MLRASVIIPTHNRPNYLREALQSVVSQEGVELDIIVIGDGEGEDAAAVVREFPGVRYVWQPQSGPNVARNHAVSLTQYDCVALLDDDDLWLPGKMRAQLEILAEHPDAAYVFSDFYILRDGRPLIPNGLSTWGIPRTERDRLLIEPLPPAADFDFREAGRSLPGGYRVDLYRPLLQHPYVLPTTAVFRKSFLTPDIRFVDTDFICGDWEFFARLSKHYAAIYMSVETACNRSHEEAGRLTRTPGAIQLQCRLEMIGRVWADDEEFMADPDNRTMVLNTRFQCLLALAKHQLRDGDGRGIRESLDQIIGLGWKIPALLRTARLCTSVPGGLFCLRTVYQFMAHARRLLGF